MSYIPQSRTNKFWLGLSNSNASNYPTVSNVSNVSTMHPSLNNYTAYQMVTTSNLNNNNQSYMRNGQIHGDCPVGPGAGGIFTVKN